MVKSKAIKLEPQGINGVMDVGDPSALNTSLTKPQKVNKNKADKEETQIY
jgi:hypothetical protein